MILLGERLGKALNRNGPDGGVASVRTVVGIAGVVRIGDCGRESGVEAETVAVWAWETSVVQLTAAVGQSNYIFFNAF